MAGYAVLPIWETYTDSPAKENAPVSGLYIHADGAGGRVFPPQISSPYIVIAVIAGILGVAVILLIIALISRRKEEKVILSKLDGIWNEKASTRDIMVLSEDVHQQAGLHGVTADYIRGLLESSKAMSELAHLSLESLEDRLSPGNLESVVALEKARAAYAELQKTANVHTLISSELPRFADRVFDYGNPPEIPSLVMFPSGRDGSSLFGSRIIDRTRSQNARTLFLSVIYSISLTDRHSGRYSYEDLYKWFRNNNARAIRKYFEEIFIPAAEDRKKSSGIVRYRAGYILEHVGITASLKSLSAARSDVLAALRALRDGKDPSYITAAEEFIDGPRCLWRKDVLERADRLQSGSIPEVVETADISREEDYV